MYLVPYRCLPVDTVGKAGNAVQTRAARTAQLLAAETEERNVCRRPADAGTTLY